MFLTANMTQYESKPLIAFFWQVLWQKGRCSIFNVCRRLGQGNRSFVIDSVYSMRHDGDIFQSARQCWSLSLFIGLPMSDRFAFHRLADVLSLKLATILNATRSALSSAIEVRLRQLQFCLGQSMAAKGDEDGVAPALVRAQPDWVAALLALAKKDFGKLSSEQTGAFLKHAEANQAGGSILCSMPLGAMDFQEMAIPGCWPLKGTVVKAKTHWYEDRLQSDYKFPPADKMMHLAFFGPGLLMTDVGKLQRENCDVLLAWLLRYSEAVEAKDTATISAMQKAAERCACTLHSRGTDQDKLAAAYQLVEDEEKAASLMGHSVLTRARELNALQDLGTLFVSGTRSSQLLTFSSASR